MLPDSIMRSELFPDGVCELCGRSGRHPACEERALELQREFDRIDAEMLRQHALFGARGLCSNASSDSFAAARRQLVAYLQRPLDLDPGRAIEGDTWWFLPEGWIGMIGFIVEKATGAVLPLGSGVLGLHRGPRMGADWIAIQYYLSWQAAADNA
jgi:hypothetical protein